MDIDKNIGIYKITNNINGKVYIGQTRNFKRRKNKYRNLLCVGQPKIYNSIKKHGWDNFTFEVLCNCDIEDLNFWEYDYYMIYQQLLGENMMLNLKAGGGARLYTSGETRKKISDSKKGSKHVNYGKKLSEDTRKKQSESQKGELNHMFGKTHSLEARKKLSDSHRGDKHVNFGKKLPKETVAKMIENSYMRNRIGELNHISKKVNQYELDGRYIKTYACIDDVNKEYGFDNSDIVKVCKGKRRTSKGYIWRYHSEYPNCEDLDISTIKK